MLLKSQTITQIIEKLAPRRWAEDWDNTGLNIGDPAASVEGVLITLDVTPDVVKEASAVGANLIISHHPLIFKPQKHIRQDNPQGRLITEIIRRNINVYCAHTNLDNTSPGVNDVLAEKLGLSNVQVLNPDKPDKIHKLVVFVPQTHAEEVRNAITAAGAGCIGNYSDCTFSTSGTGTFKASQGCNPYLGKIGELEDASEIRLETVIRENQVDRVVRAMLKAHPYEEVAYDIYPLVNDAGRFGLGRIGSLDKPLLLLDFVDMVKKSLNITSVRYGGKSDKQIKKVAVCGGSGASLIHKAVFSGADIIVTGDLKYHEAQDALELGLSFVDAGHYATEAPVLSMLYNYLTEALGSQGISVPVSISKTLTDPFKYF